MGNDVNFDGMDVLDRTVGGAKVKAYAAAAEEAAKKAVEAVKKTAEAVKKEKLDKAQDWFAPKCNFVREGGHQRIEFKKGDL